MDEAQILGRIVAPFAGAWIEINARALTVSGNPVAPFAGAWIEIAKGYYK